MIEALDIESGPERHDFSLCDAAIILQRADLLKTGELLYRLRDLRFLLAEQLRDALAGHRLADEVALHPVAARDPQGVRLVFRIHALGHDLHAQRARERDDGRDERHRARLLQHADDEGAVDLERLHRELREIAERGIAGAEVVDGDAHAQLAQGSELLDVRRDFLHENAFGDLEVEPVRRRALADRLLHYLDEIRPAQLDRRTVY